MKGKTLTRKIVEQNGWDKLKTITADMLEGYTRIEDYAFYGYTNLTSITIPNSVINIGHMVLGFCFNLVSVTIHNSVIQIELRTFYGCGFKVEKRYDEQGRLIAYKGFNADMTCRRFQYEEGKSYELDGKIELCHRGFHACTNPLDCFNYYFGEIGKNVVFHEVYLEDVLDEHSYDSKIVAMKITIGREISLFEMADIASGRK